MAWHGVAWPWPWHKMTWRGLAWHRALQPRRMAYGMACRWRRCSIINSSNEYTDRYLQNNVHACARACTSACMIPKFLPERHHQCDVHPWNMWQTAHTSAYAHMHTQARTCACMHEHIQLHDTHMHERTHARTHTHACTHKHTSTHARTQARKQTRAHTRAHAQVRVRTHVRAFTHADMQACPSRTHEHLNEHMHICMDGCVDGRTN